MGNIFNCLRENQTVIEELTNAIVVIDREGIINTVNARALELLGVTAEYAVGRHMQEVYPESKLTRTILTGETERTINLEIRERNCIASRVPLYAEGEIVGAV